MSPTNHTVVVTGIGATTPLGGDAASTWEGLVAGRSGVKPLEQEWAAEQAVKIAAPVAVEPGEVIPRPQARKLDRSAQFALIAAQEAWKDAGFEGRAGEDGSVDPDRLGAVIASGIGGVTTLLDQYDVLKEKGVRRVSPHTVPMLMPNSPSANVGLLVGARAGVHTPVSACASGAEAIGYAIEMIRTGRADVVVAAWYGGGHPPAADRRVRQHDGDVQEQRRPAGRLAPLRRRPRRLRPRRGQPAWSSWSPPSTPPSAVRGCTPRRSGRASRPTRTTSCSRSRRGGASRTPCRTCWTAPTWTRPRWCTSTRTRRRRRPVTSPS